jgi:hypothetical protein
MSAMLNHVVNGGGVLKVGQASAVGSAMSPESSFFHVTASADVDKTPTKATAMRSRSALLARLPIRLFPIRERPPSSVFPSAHQ